MDFRIENIIITDNNIGIIDLESMKNGDSVFDFVKMNRLLNKYNFNCFLEEYKSIRKLDDNFENKLNFYSLFDSYTSLYWCASKKELNTEFYKINYNIVLNYLEKIKK